MGDSTETLDSRNVDETSISRALSINYSSCAIYLAGSNIVKNLKLVAILPTGIQYEFD